MWSRCSSSWVSKSDECRVGPAYNRSHPLRYVTLGVRSIDDVEQVFGDGAVDAQGDADVCAVDVMPSGALST